MGEGMHVALKVRLPSKSKKKRASERPRSGPGSPSRADIQSQLLVAFRGLTETLTNWDAPSGGTAQTETVSTAPLETRCPPEASLVYHPTRNRGLCTQIQSRFMRRALFWKGTLWNCAVILPLIILTAYLGCSLLLKLWGSQSQQTSQAQPRVFGPALLSHVPQPLSLPRRTTARC